MLLLFLLPAALAAGSAPPLAPGPDTYVVAFDRLDGRLRDARATDTALSRVHNGLGQAFAEGRGACADGALLSLAARSAPLGALHRGRVQAARAALAETEALAARPTIAPVAEGPLGPRLESAREETRRLTTAFLEQRAWHAAYVAPLTARCGATPVAAPGLGAPQEGLPVAVVVASGGQLCPAAVPGTGAALLLARPEACWTAAAQCDCAPVTQQPGAVLGPPAPEAPVAAEAPAD